MKPCVRSSLVFLSLTLTLAAPRWTAAALRSGDDMLADYFQTETHRIQSRCLTDVHTLAGWKAKRDGLRQELFEMLSLSPLPTRTALKPVITGKLDQEQFTVENLHFQSMPGLYVTANLYVPKNLSKPAPAILYVCGHAYVRTNGISYGNKTAYQHHGEWFARNGYVCLIIDTVQLGEIQGIHHGTYREGMWWWNSRGYTPAGVEAWNSMRALDYLQSRPEVDPDRLGVTGRSGGGAYSWWLAALDERVKVAAPVAGITDLQNHVVDGTVEGHCDCMFMVNTYRWDYPTVAALVAPRPLLICNSDKDSIFPLDGVVRLHDKVARIYALYGATNNLGLLITEGPHHDTQDLQLPVFRWFNRHLKGEDPLIDMAARPFFTAQQLRVFDGLPSDERTSKIHETFVPQAHVSDPPHSNSEWTALADGWKTVLKQKVFGAWPDQPASASPELITEQEGAHGERLQVYEFHSDQSFTLRLYVLRPASGAAPESVRVRILDQAGFNAWTKGRAAEFPVALRDEAALLATNPPAQLGDEDVKPGANIEVVFTPRGIGLAAWKADPRKQIQIRRRFMLLGTTLDSMRVWDIRRALQSVRAMPQLANLPLTVQAEGDLAVDTAYAALFEPGGATLNLSGVPASHQSGPDYLNVLRFMDIPQAVAMAAQNNRVSLLQASLEDWSYPIAVAKNLLWPPDQFHVVPR